MIAAYVLVWLALGAATTALARSKGRGLTEGILLGFLLGIIGLAIELLLPSQAKQAAAHARTDRARRKPRSGEAGRMAAELKADREGDH
jgi:hypothetical protein